MRSNLAFLCGKLKTYQSWINILFLRVNIREQLYEILHSSYTTFNAYQDCSRRKPFCRRQILNIILFPTLKLDVGLRSIIFHADAWRKIRRM